MAIATQIIKSLNNRSSVATPEKWLVDWFKSNPESNAGVYVNEENSLNFSAVFACVAILSNTVGMLPIKIYERLSNSERRIANDFYLYKIIHDKPSEYMSAFRFKQTMQGHLATWGNAFAKIEYNNKAEVTALSILRPDKMNIITKNNTIVYEYKLNASNTILYNKEDIFHIPGFGYDGIRGYSIVSLARESIGAAMATESFGAKFFGKGTHPSAVIQRQGKLDPETHKTLKQDLQDKYSGLGSSHKLLLLEEGMEYKQIGIPPEDAQFLQTRKFHITDIARWFLIPPHMIGDLERATFCLPANSEIMTDNGNKYIVDLKKGDVVWSLGANGLQKSKIKNCVCNGLDDVYEIKTTNRTLLANLNHKILIRKKYSDPKKGVGGYQKIKWVNEYVCVKDLKVKDVIIVLDSLPESKNNNYSIGFMEFCGLLLGDGNIYKKWGISIARARNALYMDYYRDVMKEEFKCFGKNGNGRNRNIKRQQIKLLEYERQTKFASVETAEKLEKLGFSGNAKTKKVPEWIWNLSDDLKFSFLRGFLDADGSVDKKGRICFGSCNEFMLSQIRHLCISLGVPVTNLRKSINMVKLPNGKLFNSEFYCFTCSDPKSNRKIGSHDPRYQERLKNGKPFDKKCRKYPRFGGINFNYENLALSKIISIKKVANEPVYDLEVENTHSFIANGVVVHNSNIEHQGLHFATYTMGAWFELWKQEIQLQLINPEINQQRYYADFVIDALLRGDIETRYKAYSIARNWGWKSANDVRKLENEDPITGGDIYLTPLNMIPTDQVNDIPEKPKNTLTNSINNQYQKRSDDTVAIDRTIRGRNNIIKSYNVLFMDSAANIVRMEKSAITKAVKKHLGARNKSEFMNWLYRFYENDITPAIIKRMLPVFLSFGNAVNNTIADELQSEMSDQEIEVFVKEYSDTFSKRYIGSSTGQINKLLEDNTPDIYNTVIEERLNEWEERRPGKIAQMETNQLLNAITTAIYTYAGVQYLRWVTQGESCPFCSALNNKIIGINESFVGGGDKFKPEGAEHSMYIRSSKKHPPLHEGCDCYIVAS